MSYLLRDGTILPDIGFGTAGLDANIAIESITFAIRTGYRLIDTAPVYGTEKYVGQAIKNLSRRGDIRREDMLIETKLANEDQGYYNTLRAFDRSLNELEMDYIDIYLIHWPIPKDHQHDYKELNCQSWSAMEELKKAGRIKSIGVCNFLRRHIENLIQNGGEVPTINQVELHLEYQEKPVIEYCQENNIKVEAWSPFRKGQTFQNRQIRKFAAEKDMTVPELVYAWNRSMGSIPIVKSSSHAHIEINYKNAMKDKILLESDLAKLGAFDDPEAHMDFWNYKRQLMY